MNDRQTNGAHAKHYIDAAAQAHQTIVRLRDENAALRWAVEQLGRALAQAHVRTDYLENQLEWAAQL